MQDPGHSLWGCRVNVARMSGKIQHKSLYSAGIMHNLAKQSHISILTLNYIHMLTQPELGKIIADLRKSKGWTQEELVEKCNLSVRTIQRIESGEVTPRSYTTRLLLAALEYDLHVLEESTPSGVKSSVNFRQWLSTLPLPSSKCLKSFIQKNLNLMKKVILLSLALCAVAFGMYQLLSKSDARKMAEARASIVQSDQNYVKWFNSRQIDSCLTIYADDACLFGILAPNICGKLNILQNIQNEMNTGYIIMEQKMDKFRMEGSMAVGTGTWIVKMPDGSLVNGKFITEWKKVGKKWLIVTDAGSITP